MALLTLFSLAACGENTPTAATASSSGTPAISNTFAAGGAAASGTPTTPPPGAPPTVTGQVQTTADGLKYIDTVVGTGATAKAGDIVQVNYTGYLKDGTKFDSSYDRQQAFSFTLGQGDVIKGWDEGVVGMKEGGKRRLIIPSDLGYGPTANGPIPANSELTFDVELLKATPVPPMPTITGQEQTTADGVKYTDIVVGTGASPTTGQTVTVNFTYYLAAGGKRLGSTDDGGKPISFALGDKNNGNPVGWEEGIMSMKAGGKRRIIVPAALAFGATGANTGNGTIPPNADLIFDTELVGVGPAVTPASIPGLPTSTITPAAATTATATPAASATTPAKTP